jgi:hypothetical protein
VLVIVAGLGIAFNNKPGGAGSGSSSGSSNRDEHVSGYTHKDGTAVAPYVRSSPGSKK